MLLDEDLGKNMHGPTIDATMTISLFEPAFSCHRSDADVYGSCSSPRLSIFYHVLYFVSHI